ncbi:lipase member H-like [Zerene cesonia]|uniref:lipase member H-like n=1 Tax=Zerene cesonia TaxID=33412 RepID=UPI0018E514F2|nr:lipase member H-like [Zerene cesonia]
MEWTRTVRTAYTNNVDANFILLDWEEEAKQGSFGFALGYALSGIPNAMKVGAQLGDAILQLEDAGEDLNSMHLIGHSLGAHLISYAADKLNQSGKMVGRITGLDPAGPLYSGPPYNSGLRASNAKFVVGIHTDPGTYGTTNNVGHVDIWVNCGERYQPGCDNTLNLPFGQADSCSHNRAPLIYAESLGNTTAFPAIQASGCADWRANYDGQGDVIYIGENIDPG